jgi:hypothetical protein
MDDMDDEKNLRGTRYGALVVFTAVEGYDGAKWLCRCDCGNELKANREDLLAGKSLDCGCGRGTKP